MTLTTDIAAALKYTDILNDEGEPMMVYHHTNANFDRFDASFLGQNTDDNASSESWAATAHLGFWFTRVATAISWPTLMTIRWRVISISKTHITLTASTILRCAWR